MSESSNRLFDRATDLSEQYRFRETELSNSYFEKDNADSMLTTNNSLMATYLLRQANDTGIIRAESEEIVSTEQEIDPITGYSIVQTETDVLLNLEPFNSTDPKKKEVRLVTLATDAENVELKSTDQNIVQTDFYGINGGFFTGGRGLYSIAVNDHVPVNRDGDNDPRPLPPESETGSQNFFYRGTVYYDGKENVARTAGVDKYSRFRLGYYPSQPGSGERVIPVEDVDDYWAQGGLSIELMVPESQIVQHGLTQKTLDELGNIGGPDDLEPRSALVYDNLTSSTEVYLIATEDPSTLGEFRAAIKGAFPNADGGIFLDGGGSTQIQGPTISISGDDNFREVPQMLVIGSRPQQNRYEVQSAINV